MSKGKSFPTKEAPYFYGDMACADFEYFENKEDRDEAVKDAIQAYLDADGWDEQVEQIIVGEVTGVSTQFDKREPQGEIDENGDDENGDYFGSFDYICNYKIEDLKGDKE